MPPQKTWEILVSILMISILVNWLFAVILEGERKFIDETQGGTLEIYKMPGHLIRRLHQISVAEFASTTSEAGFDLTPVQFAALTAISANPGTDQATLAGLIFYDRVTIGGVVDRLEHKGYVERIVNSRDRRARQLFLTEEGRATLNSALPSVEQVQENILARLGTSEQEEFMRLLKKACEAQPSLATSTSSGK
jgi:DNA-binding MarR family transcriptional regulator